MLSILNIFIEPISSMRMCDKNKAIPVCLTQPTNKHQIPDIPS